MSWSLKLLSVAGIPVQMHLTFLLLMGWVGLSSWMREGSVQATLAGLGTMLALFGCVLLHEFGHAFMARRYGIKTLDITLLPIGGVARLEKMPDEPRQELWVAVAGPLVNVFIAAALAAILAATRGVDTLVNWDARDPDFLQRLLTLNVFLVGFNLLPAFPMDGGRILRAVLAMRMDYASATRYAAGIGQAMAFLLGFVGLFGSPLLLLIALFVWIGAGQESRAAEVKSAFADIPVERAMQTNFAILSPTDRLSRAVTLILDGSQQDFPVVWEGEVIGLLTRTDLIAALGQDGQEGAVSSVMLREFGTALVQEPLEGVLERFGASNGQTMPVLRDGRLAGLLTLENVSEFLMIQSALRGSAR